MKPPSPITIADYDPSWPAIFLAERDLIYATCGRDAFVRIEHIGSTAVPGLAAKPVIDIMPGLRSLDDAPPVIEALQTIGYEYVPEFEHDTASGPGMPFRRYFRKDRDGRRAFHLHMVAASSDFWRYQLRFRNWLRYRDEDREAYARLKHELAERFNERLRATGAWEDVNTGYTDFKADFVRGVLAKMEAKLARSAPIRLAEYDPAWAERYERERARIIELVGELAAAVEHVGSTSVPGLAAKPTVDVAVGVRSIDDARRMVDPLVAAGYKFTENAPDWFYFDDGRQDTNDRVHVHVVPLGGRRWRAYLALRDRLRADPEARAAYERLKRELAAEFVNDRLGYPDAKGEFIEALVAEAESAEPVS